MDFITFIPPGLATVGGLISVFLKNLPIAFPENIRWLALAMYTIVVWVGYFITLIVGEYLFYMVTLTILLLATGFILFLLILRQALRNRQDEITYKTALYYALGLLFISMGFTNHAAPDGKVIFVLPEDTVISVEYTGASGNGELYFHKNPFETGLILDLENLDKIQEIIFYDSNHGAARWKRETSLQSTQRGLGEVYYLSHIFTRTEGN